MPCRAYSAQSIPLTLNKYLYGNSDPVNHIDPGGDFTTLADVSIGINFQTNLRVQSAGVSVGTAVTVKTKVMLALATSVTVASNISVIFAVDTAVKENIRRCMEDSRVKGRSNCGPVLPMLIIGNDNDQIQDHISDAQANLFKPKVVTRRYKSHDRSWLRHHIGPNRSCSGMTGTDCDEYPMAIHVEGGEQNIPSLRSVSASQNRSVGALARWLHTKCKVSVNEKYIVVPMSGMPASGYICKR